MSFTESLIHDKRAGSVALLLGITALVSVAYLLWNRRRRKLPPGPMGVPILGYYPFLKKKPVEKIMELARKYGGVMGMYIGPKYVVFLSDWEAVKDGLGQNATTYRPLSVFEKVPYKFGFAGANGPEWMEVRRLTSKVLKDGLQRNSWEDLIEKQISQMVALVAQEGDKPLDVTHFFRDSFSSNIVSLVFGGQFNIESKTLTMISKTVDFIMENLQTISMINFSEVITIFLWLLGFEQNPPFQEKTREFLQFVSDAVDFNKQNLDSEINESFLSRSLNEAGNQKKTKKHTYMTDSCLKGNVVALMVGGNETTRTTIIWTLIAMADHPEKQKKVHEELDRVIGKEGSIRWSDRSQIPYTLASLLESMRWRTVAPFPAMRMANEDVQIKGYHIPKGTFIATNLKAVHYDPRYWENPEEFIPERFLSEDGLKVNMAPDSFMPFSYGKRNCPGRLLALMDMLQFFGTLMQKFKVVPKEGDKVKCKPSLGLSYQARNAELRFIAR